MPPIATIIVWVQDGEQLVQLGVATYDALKALFTENTVTDAADDAALAKLDALYAARIQEAETTPTAPPA